MKSKIHKILFTIIMASFLFQSVFAQTDQRVIRDFNELKAYLSKIWIVVQRFENEKAHRLMIQAKQELDIAEDLIFNQQRYEVAKVHMLRARSFGNQAAKLVLSQPVNRLKKQLDDLINQAENNQAAMQSDEARYLLNQAKKFRKLAYDALSKGKFNKAQEYYRIAFYFADKSLNLSTKNNEDVEIRIAELKSNIELLFNQVEDLVNKNDNTRFSNLLIDARKHYADALQLLDNGKTNLTLKRLQLIEKLLFRIIDQVDRSSLNENDRIENDLYSMKAFLDALEKDAEENSANKVDMFLNRAKSQYLDAERAFETGKFELVKTKLNLCQRFASKALQLLKAGINTESANLESRLNDNKRLLEFQKSQIEKSGDKLLFKMHKEADRLTNKATNLYEQNNQRTALNHLQLSTRIMNRIQRQLDYGNSIENSQDNEIQSKLKRTESLLNKLKNNQQINSEFQIEIEQLEKLYSESDNHFKNQNYEVANEYLNYILQQINKLTNEWNKLTK